MKTQRKTKHVRQLVFLGSLEDKSEQKTIMELAFEAAQLQMGDKAKAINNAIEDVQAHAAAHQFRGLGEWSATELVFKLGCWLAVNWHPPEESDA